MRFLVMKGKRSMIGRDFSSLYSLEGERLEVLRSDSAKTA